MSPAPIQPQSSSSINMHFPSGSNLPPVPTTGNPSSSSSSSENPQANSPMMNWIPFRDKILGEDLNVALATCQEIRERIEIVHTTEYTSFLRNLLPPFFIILTKRTRPENQLENVGYKLRHVIMEILNRLPNNDILRPYTVELLNTAMSVLIQDYEENALISSRIIFDLHKNYRPMLIDNVQQFLSHVQVMYRNLPGIVLKEFSIDSTSNASSKVHTNPPPPPRSDSTDTSGSSNKRTVTLLRSSASFRVLTECPVTVMLLFQLYPKYIQFNIPVLIPLMMHSLGLQPPLLSNPTPTHLLRHKELVSCQVKTLSFLTYMLRAFADLVRPFEDTIPESVVKLMMSCPDDTRKELLLATRHILATDFRKGFRRQIDRLLDEKILIGTNRQNYETLRPLGYSALADLILHFRKDLSLLQLSRVIHIFSKIVHDSSLTISIQTTSVRLLLNLVGDGIYNNKDVNPKAGKSLLLRILESLVNKFGTLQNQMEKIRKDWKKHEGGRVGGKEAFTSSETKIMEGKKPELKGLDRNTSQTLESLSFTNRQQEKTDTNKYNDIKLLIKTMVLGLKTVIWCVNNVHRPPNSREKTQTTSITSDSCFKISRHERTLLKKYLEWGFSESGIGIFKMENGALPLSKDNATSLTEYREVLDNFAASISVFDTYVFQTLVGITFPNLYESIIQQDMLLLAIPLHLVNNKTISKISVDVILCFAVKNLEVLAHADATHLISQISHKSPDLKDASVEVRKSFTILRLFKIVFQSVSAYSENEEVLRPHLQTIVVTCLRSAVHAKSPANYFYLLRSLFRSISGGKFELSYKEVLPLLPTILNGLNRYYAATENHATRNTIVELCLIIPARLSSLLPHLPLLMRLMVHALSSHGDLVNLGLRTLEFWVDNLNPEFLYPIMSHSPSQLTDLMSSLCSHLRPALYPYGMLALRLLGKLGGRNRRWLRESMDFGSGGIKIEHEYCGVAAALQLKCAWNTFGDSIDAQENGMSEILDNTKNFLLPLDKCLVVAVKTLKELALTSNPKPTKENLMETIFQNTSTSNLDTTFLISANFTQATINIMAEVATCQSRASLNLIKAIIASIVEINEVEGDSGFLFCKSSKQVATAKSVVIGDGKVLSSAAGQFQRIHKLPSMYMKDGVLESVYSGLFYAMLQKELEVEATLLLRGLIIHLLLALYSHADEIIRVDFNGNIVEDFELDQHRQRNTEKARPPLCSSPKTPSSTTPKSQNSSNNNDSMTSPMKLQPMASFGCFSSVKWETNPFILNETLVKLFCDVDVLQDDSKLQKAIGIMKYMKRIVDQMHKQSSEKNDGEFSSMKKIGEKMFENLLSCLCQACFKKPWNLKAGGCEAIRVLCSLMGHEWTSHYQVELIHVAIFVLKDAPKEVSSSAIRNSLKFLLYIFCFFYGTPNPQRVLWDNIIFSNDEETNMANKVIDHVRVELDSHFLTVSPNKTVPDLVIQILVRELMCSKHLVRFGVRFGLQHLASATCTTVGNLLAGQSSVLKQLLLSRPLRLLPLPEQVGIVESLAFIIARAPSVFSLSESNLLRCLSDLLTMASGADGETTVRIEPGIDKDGHATVNKNSPNKDLNLVTTHASAIFLRGSCKVLLKHQKTEVQIAVPAELPMGVQLRVSILLLFHEIILKHTVEFFEAPASTSIGNIRPHVISLLFRSLISHPPQAVSAAHTALKYILSMSSGPKGQSVDSPSSSHNRLPKEIPKDLLQACLRPVLLNLSDYRKLTVPLLRGLSRLLSLLSSWFNKTLGEKLIDHLRNWSNPAKIMHDGIWRPGEEPLVAAEIVGLFELLPQASFFVEPLVCVCIDLETKLSKFKGFSGTTSPYRVPLTKYLNKYAKETVNFFMRKQRLGNSIFSDLFQEVINQPYASKIRSYLSGTEGTSLLAQLCFNRPFDVEKKVDAARKKGGASVMSAEYLSVHGIVDYDLDDDDQSDLLQISLQRTLDEKKTKSHLAKKGAEKAHMQYVAFTKTPSATEVQIHDAKIRRDLAFEEMKDAEKEEELASQALHNAMKKKEAPELIASQQNAGVGDDGTISVKMTRGSLELLLQGITIIQTLMQWDGDYVRGSNHKNIASTIRYLWKGRGRRLRLINEDRMHPKYHAESYLYAQFLMKYFRLHTMDVSLLFELLIIFLHPTSIDFSFVKEFLETVVSTILSEPSKRKLLLRFFGVLNMEGADIETIILSMQILVEPMLRYHFETENAKGKLGGRQPASRGSVAAEKKETEQGIIIHSSLDVNAGNRSDIVDATVIQDFMLKAIAANSNVVVSSRSERFHVELLKMSTLFIQFMGKEMMEYRKELIKFAWNHLKSEDSISKHWAYINVCRFIDTYETPSKIILQVYVALLRTHQPEARDSVTSALDILIPALRRRLPVADFIKAIKWTKKVMYEEGHALQQLTHIWLVIARHPHIFYDYRSQFMTHMVNSLNRLGLPSNSPVETRILSLDLAQLIIAWENLTMKKKKNLAEDGNNTAMPVLPTLSPSRSGDEDFSLNPTLCGIVVSFLVRLALLTTSTSDKNETQLCCKSIMLLTTSLETWNEKAVPRIEYFEKVLGACYAENIAASPSPIEKRFKDKNGKSKTVSHKGSVTTQSNKLPLPKVNPNSKKRPLPTENNDKSGQISVTPSTLATCLEIFLIFLKYTPQNRFLLDNIDYLIVTFRPCFEAANSSNKREEASSNKIKELLQKFIVTLFSKFPDREVAPPELIQSQIFQHIWELMESVLTLSEDNTMSVENSSPNLPTSEAPGRFAPSNRNISKEQQDSDNKKPRKCPLYILQIIDQVYELGNSNFCEYFIQTLLKLAMYLVKTHADAASLGKKSMIAMMSRDGSHSSQHALATPILSVLDEIAGHRNESDVSGEKSVPKIAEPNDAIQSVMLCLKLLSVSSIPYSFSEERKTFFKIFNMLLDQSNNIHLLCQSVGILGNWLLDGADCPLTLSEKQSFIWKTVLFENLPETQAQLLSKMVARIVLSIQDQKMKRETKSKHSTKHLDAVVKDSDLKETKLPLHYDLFLERSIVAGLFGTDSSLRSTFFHLYGRQSSAKHSKASSEYLSSGSIVDRSPLDVLWQLLHSDLEGVGNRFWPLLFVEMLLAISDHGGGVELQNNNDVTVGTSAYHKEDIEKLPLPCDAPLSVLPSVITPSEYHQFTKVIQAEKTAASHGRGRCLSAIRILIHGDVDACADLFKVLLQQSWENLSNSSRLNLLPPLEYLLASSVTSQFLHVSKDWPDKNAVPSSQSSSRYANIIQCILRAFLTLNPIPVLDPCLLITLARNFNCWHEAIQMLEGRYYKSTEDERRTLGSHLRECYEELGERDLATAVMQDVCQNLSLKRAISFDMYGRVMDASAAYNALFGVLVSEQETLSTKQPLSIEELGIWEQRWIETSRESCHWDILYDFSKSNNSTLLLMECAWRSCNWDTVRSLFTTPSFVAALEAGDPRHKMNEIFLAIAGDGKFADVEKLCAQAVQLCLHRWQLLPHLSSKCLSHVSLLQSFQRLVELRESGHIMMEMNAHSSNRTYPDLKNILSAWRDRLPNPWENLIVWEDLFVWRSHIFDAISSNFHWGEPNAVATLHDRPWTSIRLAQIARKQGVTDLSIRSLNRLQADTTMDVSDAFSKLREQIICCRDIKSPDKVNALRSGLNMINTTNLVFFDSYQKSELFRLKASFFSHLGSQSSANQAYCHSVQIMSSYGKAWHSWGRHCHNLAQATEKDAAVSSSTDKKDSTGTLGGKSVQYLAQAMGCFLEAVKCGHGTSSSLHLPRCLWMLRRDENRPGLLCQTLEDKALTLPVWVWLPWIPQLLTGLTRIESRVAKAILSKIIERYPQAVYYTLRAFYLERRDVERARSSSAKVNPAIVEHEQKHGTAVSHSEELMSTLRRKHPALWSSLESILAELIVRFRPSLEEELLAAVTALHQKAIQLYQTSQVSASSIEKEEEVPSNLIHTLSRVSIKFFRSPMDSSDQQKFFCKKYQESFEQDFLGESSSNRSKDKTSTSAESAVSAGVYPSATSNIVKSSNMKMSVLIARLGNWKDVLQCHVLSTPPKLPLQHQSPVLSSIVNEAPDLWKGACESLFPHEKLNCSPTTATSLSGSGAAATAFAAAEAAARAVSAAATSEGCGGSYGGGSSVVEIPGQYPPNFKGPPSPELNAKLIRFDPVVETIRRQGHLVRRIGMLGSDGKTHKFVLQFGIPYLTRTDERTSQLHNVIDMLLQKNMMASRRYLSVRAGAVVPIAQRLRLAADESSHYSLEDVYCLDRSMKGLDPDEPNTFFNEEVTNQLRARRSKRDDKATSSSGEDQQKEIGYKSTTDKFQNSNSDDKSINEEKTSVEKKVKRIVFDKICSNIVPDTILQNFIQDAFQMPDAIFAFRKAFACHAAASSLLQYTMNAAERGPHKFVLNMKNAQIYSPDFRLMYNNQGLLEGTNTVPFRMTRNIESTIGPLMTEGTFVPAMANVASAVQKKMEDMEPVFSLILRDDIISWHASKSSTVRSDLETQHLESVLIERITKNVASVKRRFEECALKKEECIKSTGGVGDDGKRTDDIDIRIDAKVRKLLLTATSSDSLCMMNPILQSWL